MLFSTRLAQQNETVRVGFVAPADPGAYVFVCTFPGHWMRMYGVMLVVPSLEAWEARPTAPLDPMTGKPFPQWVISRRCHVAATGERPNVPPRRDVTTHWGVVSEASCSCRTCH